MKEQEPWRLTVDFGSAPSVLEAPATFVEISPEDKTKRISFNSHGKIQLTEIDGKEHHKQVALFDSVEKLFEAIRPKTPSPPKRETME